MEVIAICRSRKAMRAKAASVLDRYLFRIGDRTWRGRASMECMRRISKDLKKVASRNMSVCLYRSGAKERDMRPLFHVGSRALFDADGRCPVSIRSRERKPSSAPGQDFLLSITEIAALFHDIGKASNLFQRKLRMAMGPGVGPITDAVRHELMSALVLAGLISCKAETSADVAAELLETCDHPEKIEQAWHRASEICRRAYESKNPGWEILTAQGGPASAPLGDAGSFRAQLILLILSHHRLPEANHLAGTVSCGVHVTSELPLAADALDIAPGVPFWREDWFIQRLRRAAERLAACKMPSAEGLDIWARTALMSADHLGSRDSVPAPHGDEVHIANTDRRSGGPADSLLKHVQRVTKLARTMSLGSLLQGVTCPGISPDLVPGAIAAPRISGSRFDWQARAAYAAAGLVEQTEGGFFATLIAGTGSGKTRGAATVMAAAARHDLDETRRALRYNLALPLRDLASQSGREYVEDLQFAPSDVSVMIGGHQAQWKEDDQPSDASGSEDRFGEMVNVASMEDEDLSLDFTGLGAETDRHLPVFLERLCEGKEQSRLRQFLSTPILSATIDHFMPAASPEKGSHLAATHRVMSADLIIDEIDLLGEEDLSAVKRLVRVAGLSGRRVVLMSATLPADVAREFHAIYAQAWRSYAALSGKPEHIHHLCAGDGEGALFSSAMGADFGTSFAECKKVLSEQLAAQAPHRIARILPRAQDWQDQVEIIRAEARRMHVAHSEEIDGRKVSVGLIRITRIKHLQALAVALAAADDGSHYVVLHGAMPRLQRDLIERDLKRALTRKGTDPQAGLSRFIARRVSRAPGEDIRIIVLASPVIETGNDIDFDWLIADPSSIRSLIQAAGRVNRHRMRAVSEANIAILGDYMVAREVRPDGSPGRMERPGVETRHIKADVAPITIATGRSSAELLALGDSFTLDARLGEREEGLAGYEAELRKRFRDVARRDFAAPVFWWSRSVARHHRFRRRTGVEISVYPIFADETSWGFFAGWRGKDFAPVSLHQSERSVFRGAVLFPESLETIAEQVKGISSERATLSCPLDIRLRSAGDVASEIVLDPVLGRLDAAEVPSLTFDTLR